MGASRDAVLRGLFAFARQLPSWVLHLDRPDTRRHANLSRWNPDGLIACLSDQQQADSVLKLRKPVVNVTGVLDVPSVPRVSVDDRAVGMMAAEHLLDQGLREVACLTGSSSGHCDERMAGFVEFCQQHAVACAVHVQKEPESCRVDDDFGVWLARLPKPAGLFTTLDSLGQIATERAIEAGMQVPDELAIVTAGDDANLCEITRPPLSALKLPLEQAGYEAASLLDRLMDGAVAPAQPRMLPPMHVVTRQSTDIVAVDDPELARAIALIRKHSGKSLTVKDILREVPVSRRALEMRFRSLLGRSPMEEIRRVQFNAAKRMLIDTEDPVWRVAEKCGYSSSAYLSVVFRHQLEIGPAAYRRQFRMPGAAS